MVPRPLIIRSKGVVAVARQDNRVVFQGVHMLLETQPERPWGEEARRNQLILTDVTSTASN
ncbi:GTP-binding protein [bacterium]|nr:GTP-binding protein [bacterium]